MILELRNICKTYDQGKLEVPVLKNVSLSVDQGEYLAIMGPSGSGKTTLMNIIGCLDTPTSGEYLLEGEDLSGQSDVTLSQVRLRSIGFVFQSFHLLPRQSALENVALPLLYAGVRRKDRMETAKAALERVGLGDRLDFKPTQLSGGQCQRVAIARAIVNNPKILLADEPTGALDTASGQQIMELFQKLNNEGVTIVMITHEPEIAACAQRTLHIRDGRLIDAQGHFLAPEAAEDRRESQPVSEGQPLISMKELLSPEVPVSPVQPAAPAEAVPGAKAPEDLSAEELFASPEGTQAAESGQGSALDAPAGNAEEISQEPAQDPVSPAASEKLPEAVFDIEAIAAETVDAGPEAPETPEFREPLEAKAVETESAAAPLPETPAPPPAEPPIPEIASVLDIESIHVDLEDQSEPFLDEEISALLEQEPSYETGDRFLRDAGIEPEPALEEAPAEETPPEPILVPRATKAGAPDQITFDIWARPEILEIEELPVFERESAEEPAPQPEPIPAETDAPQPETDPGETASGETASGETGSASQEDKKEEMEFDTAFDAVDPYEPQEIQAGQFGTPLKTEVDLSNAFGKAPASPSQPSKTDTGYRKLVEIDGLGWTGKQPSAPGEDDQ